MINKHLRIVRQLHARRARPAPPVHVFGDGYPCKRADPREIALPEGEVSGAGKMLLRDVQLLAIAEHRLICLNLSEAARTLRQMRHMRRCSRSESTRLNSSH